MYSRPALYWLVSLGCFLLLAPVSALAQDGGEEPAEATDETPASEVGADDAAETEGTAETPEAAPAESEAEAEGAAAEAPAETEGGEPEQAVEEPQPEPVEAAVAAETAAAETAPAEATAEEPSGRGCRCFFEDLTETDHPFTLSRGRASLALVGMIQLVGVPWIQDPVASIESHSIANTEGFRMHRARFGVAGDLPFNFGYRLLVGLGAADGADFATLLDAHLSFEPHQLARITAGAPKVPFSGIMLHSSAYQLLLQRPYIVREVAPDRSLGVEVSGRMRWLTYHVGVFNGGAEYYRGDNNEGMLYAARIAVHPLGPLPDGEITQPDSLVFQVAGSYFFNQDAPGNRHAATAELALRWSRLTVRGEFVYSIFDPIGDPATDDGNEEGRTERMGWFGEAGVFIINEHLLVGMRYEGQRILENPGIPDLSDLWAIGVGVSGFMLQGRIKLTLQYEHRHEFMDAQEDNDWLAIQLQGRI